MNFKIFILTLLLAATSAYSQSTTFTYQGRLTDAGAPAEGDYDIQFTLKDALTGSATIGSTQTKSATPVAAGIFTVELDFGATVFDGTDLWLEIAARPAGAGNYTTLAPRQPVHPTPYALHADTALGVVDGGITEAMLAAGSVSSDKLAAGAVGRTQLADGAVGSNQLASAAVLSNHLGDHAVTSAAIADGAITANKLGNGYSNGPDILAGIDFTTTPGTATFAATFPEPFAPGTIPAVSLPTGWVLDAPPTEAGFTASIPYAPVTLDTLNNNGPYSSIALVDGRPAIAYADISGDNLKFIIANDAAATSWAAPVVVDAPGDVGVHCNLGVIHGRPAIAYRDNSNSTLKYAIADDASGANWTTVTIDSAVTSFPTLRQVDGRPAIAYLDVAGDLAKYAYSSTADGANPADWTALTIAATTDTTGAELNIVDGRPAMVFLDAASNQLQYVRADDAAGTAWPIPVPINPAAGSGSHGQHSSMAIIAGHPAVAYRDDPNNLAYFVRADDPTGATWGAPVLVSSSSGHGRYNSLAVIGGRPAIAYADESGARGVIITIANDPEGTSWGARPFAAATNVRFTSLMDLDGRAAISFYDDSPNHLAFAHLPPFPEWTATGGTVFPITAANAISAMNADSADSVADGSITSDSLAAGAVTPEKISPTYYQSNGTEASATDLDDLTTLVSGPITATVSFDRAFEQIPEVEAAGWTISGVTETGFTATSSFSSETVDSAGDVGRENSLAMIGGNPAISYYDATTGDLKFARNSAADGSGTWTAVTVDSTGNVGRFTSLATIGGNPAISYFDDTLGNGDLKFARNSAADGSGSWAIVTVDSAGVVGPYTSLAMIGGNPAISYYDATNGDLKFARNSAADGSGTWTTGTVFSIGSVGSHTSLAMFGGNPAISFYDATNDWLRFTRNSAADGSGTWTTVTVDSAGDGRYTSLAMIGGKPAISYRDDSGDNLKLARNSAADGSGTWATVTVDFLGDVGTHTSLAMIGDNPAISYYDLSNDDLKFWSPPQLRHWTARDPSQSSVIAAQATGVVDGAVTSASIADDTVTGADIADGTLTGADFASSVGLWQASGANVYRNSGRVGIGRIPTSNPLEVEGNASKTTAGSWLANSDRRIKTNIEELDGAAALMKLRAVRPVEFEYTPEFRAAHPSIDDRTYLNVIAQEFAEVFPDWVKSSGEVLSGLDPDAPANSILQVDTYPLTIYSAAAIKALDAADTQSVKRIGQLEKENADLRKRLEKLERTIETLAN